MQFHQGGTKMRLRIKCITDKRPDLGANIVDPYIHKNCFYTVISPSCPGPVSHVHDWIEIQCEATHQIYQRPRYMFGPILNPNTIS